MNSAAIQSADILPLLRDANVPEPKSSSDPTLERLHELKDRLTECLVDAEDLRARIAEAREANVWPDMGPAARLFADYNDRRRAL